MANDGEWRALLAENQSRRVVLVGLVVSLAGEAHGEL